MASMVHFGVIQTQASKKNKTWKISENYPPGII